MTEQRDGRRQPFPIAAMTGEDERSAAGCERLIDVVLVVNLRRAFQHLSIEIGQPDELHHRSAEVMEHSSDGVALFALRPIGEGDGDVCERAPSVAPEHMPAEVTEKETDGAHDRERQGTGDEAEGIEPECDDATSTCSALEVSHSRNP